MPAERETTIVSTKTSCPRETDVLLRLPRSRYHGAPEFLVEGMPVRYTPVSVRVRVSWDSGGRERSVELSTLRLSRGTAG